MNSEKKTSLLQDITSNKRILLYAGKKEKVYLCYLEKNRFRIELHKKNQILFFNPEGAGNADSMKNRSPSVFLPENPFMISDPVRLIKLLEQTWQLYPDTRKKSAVLQKNYYRIIALVRYLYSVTSIS